MSSLFKSFQSLPISFGGASLSGEGAGYGFGDITREESRNLINYVFDRGIRVFDSAPIYGFGESELRLGLALKSVREKVLLVSKSGVDWHRSQRVNMTNDPIKTKNMLEDSLRRFDSDYIDLYMIHWPDRNVDIRRPMEVLAKAKAEGKIRHIGLCNTSALDLEKASEIDIIECVQGEFNIFNHQEALNLSKLKVKHDFSFMGWGPFDKGIITGRVDKARTFDKSDCRSWAPWWKAMKKDQKYETISKIRPLLEQEGHSLLDFALSFNLNYHQIDQAICGGKKTSQWSEIFDSLDNLMSVKAVEKILENF